MSVVDEYLKTVAAPERAELERIRSMIKKLAPEAAEVMTYGMPGFKYNGHYFISFAAFKDHMSLFPGAEPVAVLEAKLDDFKHAKGTIQFTLDHPLPDALVEEVRSFN